jgi:hypothetical protein
LSFVTLFLYMVPLLFCAAIAISAFSYRQSHDRKTTRYSNK